MAGKVEVRINYAGVGELLNSQWASDCCSEIANQVASRAGDGYDAASPHKTGQRVAVNVYAATKEAYWDNMDNNTLLRALG